MGETGNVTEAEGVTTGSAPRRGQHYGGRNPGEPGNADFWKRRGQQKSGEDGQETAATGKQLTERIFQPGELAATVVKCKRAGAVSEFGNSRNFIRLVY